MQDWKVIYTKINLKNNIAVFLNLSSEEERLEDNEEGKSNREWKGELS